MARANRHHIPGQVWHITHRCHKREFLRKGAFWEDRYHATAVETGEHRLRCLVYIDLNMVRNGVVKHPAQWAHGGYREIQNPPFRYGLINLSKLIECCGLGGEDELRTSHREWVEAAIKEGGQSRRPEWTESVAVGSEAFVSGVLDKLKRQAPGRQVKKPDTHSFDTTRIRRHGAPGGA